MMLLIAAGLAAASYLTTLIILAPAQTLASFKDDSAIITDATGTIWRGSARVRTGQHLSWQLRPGASVRRLGLAWSVQLEGPDTALTAQISAQLGRMRADEIDGVAGSSLLALAGQFSPATCNVSARIASGRAVLTRRAIMLEGAATAPPSTCRTAGGQTVSLPALRVQARPEQDGARISVYRNDEGAAMLADLVLAADGALEFTLTREGARVFEAAP